MNRRRRRRRRRKKRGPDEPAPSLHDGGRRRTMKRTWMGDRSLSLCGGGFCWGLGLPWRPEEAPQRARSGLETQEEPEEVVEKGEGQKHHRVHRFHIRPLRRRAASPGRPPPWWSWTGLRLPAPSWWRERRRKSETGKETRWITTPGSGWWAWCSHVCCVPQQNLWEEVISVDCTIPL